MSEKLEMFVRCPTCKGTKLCATCMGTGETRKETFSWPEFGVGFMACFMVFLFIACLVSLAAKP
jgi:hypothetical protein